MSRFLDTEALDEDGACESSEEEDGEYESDFVVDDDVIIYDTDADVSPEREQPAPRKRLRKASVKPAPRKRLAKPSSSSKPTTHRPSKPKRRTTKSEARQVCEPSTECTSTVCASTDRASTECASTVNDDANHDNPGQDESEH